MKILSILIVFLGVLTFSFLGFAQTGPVPTLYIVTDTADYNAVGDTIDYKYFVFNDTAQTFNGPVTIDDDNTTAICPNVGLAAGQIIICSTSTLGGSGHIVTQDDIDVGSVTNIATASAVYNEATVTSPSHTLTVSVTQSPALTLDIPTTTLSYVAVGDTIDYSYTVENTGNVTLPEKITIRDDETNVICIASGDGHLDVGEMFTCTADDYVVTQNDIDAGSVTNSATARVSFNVSYNQELKTVTSPIAIVTVNATQIFVLTLKKSTTTKDYSKVGDTIDYKYVVTNKSNVTLPEPITITDDKTTATCAVSGDGDLDVGEIVICTAVDYVVTQEDTKAHFVKNIATASAIFDGRKVTSPRDTVTVIINLWPLFQAAINSGIEFDLKVALEGKGHGEVRSKLPGIDCDAVKPYDCWEDYDPNTWVTLNAYPETDSIFAGWVGACESSLKPTCTFKMKNDRKVTALFTQNPVVIEEGIWWGLHNGGRPTFYFSKPMAAYPSEFVVKMAGCETVVVTNNGHRFVTNLLIIKQSDVGGRGMAVTTTGGVCESSRECSVTYYK